MLLVLVKHDFRSLSRKKTFFSDSRTIGCKNRTKPFRTPIVTITDKEPVPCGLAPRPLLQLIKGFQRSLPRRTATVTITHISHIFVPRRHPDIEEHDSQIVAYCSPPFPLYRIPPREMCSVRWQPCSGVLFTRGCVFDLASRFPG